VLSRAFYNDRPGPFLAELCRLTGLDAALPMNTGAEAVETAIKAARHMAFPHRGRKEDFDWLTDQFSRAVTKDR
jgi:ornithine--oxo-acid transaminase